MRRSKIKRSQHLSVPAEVSGLNTLPAEVPGADTDPAEVPRSHTDPAEVSGSDNDLYLGPTSSPDQHNSGDSATSQPPLRLAASISVVAGEVPGTSFDALGPRRFSFSLD